MNLIQSFPHELLGEIFEWLPFSSVAHCAGVCREWHVAAVGHSKLWTTIGITTEDAKRPDLVARVLARSHNRPISLSLDLSPEAISTKDKSISAEEKSITPVARYLLLRWAIREHLCRCERLCIYAPQEAWTDILRAFEGETFPWLLTLYLHNDDAVEQWQLSCITDPDSTLAPADVPSLSPPHHLVFPLPAGHGVHDTLLQGVSLGDPSLPNLQRLQIDNEFPGIAVNGRLNPWLCGHARELLIADLCIPALDYPTAADMENKPPAAVEDLTLRNLSITPREDMDEDGSLQHDCRPFFEALDTSAVRSLCIDSLDIESRIWYDFIDVLADAPGPKFPLVEKLFLCAMVDFEGVYDDVELFLSAFPALQALQLVASLDEIWQDLMSVLEIFPTLCPGLRQLEVGFGPVILRDDPMPFRGTYSLPF
ncbi:hypothetical protein C8R43DRAFT_1137137 [Mycena crocata]|nr:hypothetical protein C8R43DRAFT_1137137 [Mycena crocata]